MIYYWCSDRSVRAKLGWGTKKVVVNSTQDGEGLLKELYRENHVLEELTCTDTLGEWNSESASLSRGGSFRKGKLWVQQGISVNRIQFMKLEHMVGDEEEELGKGQVIKKLSLK